MSLNYLVYVTLFGIFMPVAGKTHDADDELIPFAFYKKPLIELLNTLAYKQKLTLILPQRSPDLELLKQQTITYLPTESMVPMTLDKAWALLQTFVELSGFSVAQKDPTTFVVVKNNSIEGGGAINREVLPYFFSDSSALPDSNERVRFIYYFKNLVVPTPQERESHLLSKISREMLSTDASFLFDTATNALIVTDKASHSKQLAALLKILDESGFQQDVAHIQLRHAPVQQIITLFDALKKSASQENSIPFIRSSTSADSFGNFMFDTRFIADPERNSIIILGRKANVARLKEFIQEEMDKPQDTGESVLHAIDLNYRDSQTLAIALQNVVSTLQPTQGIQAPVRYGQEHIFEGPVIMPESVLTTKVEGTTEQIILEQKGLAEKIGIEGERTIGGNRLLVAARNTDWRFIKEVIEKLDQPDYQVILEVLIVEFSYSKTAQQAGSIRTATDCPPTNGVQFLSSNITPVSNVLGNTPTQLAQDLLAVIGPDGVTNQLNPGSMLISFNDPSTPGIMGLLSFLNSKLTTKIKAYPFVLVSNHKKGSVETEEIRRTTGELVTAANGSFIIPIEDVPATLKVIATPHIMSDDRVRIDIGFTFEEFRGPRFNRVTRGLKTTATLHTNQILAMGGLLRLDTADFKSGTPILKDVPILNAFVSSTHNQTGRTNISLFILPTIIQPRKSNTLQRKTAQFIKDARADYENQTIRDPIQRIFFNRKDADSGLKNYLAQNASLHLLMPTASDKKSFNSNDLKTVLAREKMPFKQKVYA